MKRPKNHMEVNYSTTNYVTPADQNYNFVKAIYGYLFCINSGDLDSPNLMHARDWVCWNILPNQFIDQNSAFLDLLSR